jgi:hypothetical protein
MAPAAKLLAGASFVLALGGGFESWLLQARATMSFPMHSKKPQVLESEPGARRVAAAVKKPV